MNIFKSLMTLSVLSIAVSNVVIAQDAVEPQTQPEAPEVILGKDTEEVSAMLLNSQLNDCVKELQASVYRLELMKVSKQEISTEKTNYRLDFYALSGDMVVGTASLKATKEVSRGAFDMSVTVYSCSVTNSEIR